MHGFLVYKASISLLQFTTMDPYLTDTYPSSTPGMFDVKPETLTVDQKRAIGDFILFVGKSACNFLLDEINTLIKEKLSKFSNVYPLNDSTLNQKAYKALFDDSLGGIQNLWLKYRMGHLDRAALQRIDNLELRLETGLKALSRHVMEYQYNHTTNNEMRQESRMTLMQDFIALINRLKFIFEFEFSEISVNILLLFSHLAANENMRRISTFRDLEDKSVSRRLNANDVSETGSSQWIYERSPLNINERELYNKAEWDEIDLILHCCMHLPLRGVIMQALHNVSRYYKPRRLEKRKREEYYSLLTPVEAGALQDKNAGEVFHTLCFHPIFIEFWLKVREFYTAEVLHSEIHWLIQNNPKDLQLKENFTEFLRIYLEA